jgi:hypothetical protein
MTWFGGNKKNIRHCAFAERERKKSERDEKQKVGRIKLWLAMYVSCSINILFQKAKPSIL